MKTLAVLSMFGNLFIFVGLLSILVFIFLHADFTDLSPLYVGHLTNLPIFFGMAIYAFEGIGKHMNLETINLNHSRENGLENSLPHITPQV